jgi:ATP-dependent helicase HrpA
VAPSVADATEHLDRLVSAGFVARAGLERLVDVRRYVAALEHRLGGLAEDVGRDQRRMAEIRPLEVRYAQLVARQGRGPLDRSVADVGWMLEELRVSLFAQSIGARGPVSPARVGRRLADLGA